MAVATGRLRSARMPGYLNIVGALLVLLLVTFVALRATQSNPPAVAEFAPQPQHPITNAPAEQTSSFGSGAGGAGLASPAPSPSAAAGPPPGAVILPCVGDPPRQTEDPQSPPCVAYWQGDNGGATAQGVTRTTITVVLPDYDAKFGISHDLQLYFNRHYELYDRKLNLVDFNSQRPGDCASAPAAANYAVAAGAFAGTDTSGNNCYYLAFAARGLITAGGQANFTQSVLAAHAPYMWQYPMAFDQEFDADGRWICARFAGGKAVHTTPPLSLQPRKFGIVFSKYSASDDVPLDPILNQLAACGIQNVPVAHMDTITDAEQASNAMLQMSSAHVTTVICLCHPVAAKLLGSSATGQQYYPEWLLSTFLINDYDYVTRDLGLPSEQRAHAMAVSYMPKQVEAAVDPAVAAIREVDPSFNCSQQNDICSAEAHLQYRSLLLLASGIQLAGPHLTPARFTYALQHTIFPNPDTSIYAGHVGFLGGSFSMTLDGTEMWWSEAAPAPGSGNQGAWCYVQHGARHTPDSWPRGGDPFFGGGCDSGA